MTSANPKTLLFVGGLADEVTPNLLRAAFIPYGHLITIDIPKDKANPQAHRGFGLVEFEEQEDAAAAIDNMHHAELFGRVIKVDYAKPGQRIGGGGGDGMGEHRPAVNRAVWDDEAYIKQHIIPQGQGVPDEQVQPVETQGDIVMT